MKIKGNSSCKRCPLHKTTDRVCVMGHGPKKPLAVVIGEAPGAQEEKNGKPFTGKSGQLLRRLLRKHDLEDVYITNAVQCRPPDNATPSASQVMACRKWVQKELLELSTRHVLLLGNVPLASQLGMRGITKLRGRPIERDGVSYFPTFHPAYILRNPDFEDILDQDIGRFSDEVHNRATENRDISPTILRTKKELVDACRDIRGSEWVSLDLETSGLNPFERDAYIASIGIGTSTHQYCLMLNHRGVPLYRNFERQSFAAQLLIGAISESKVIAQNGKFDSMWLKVIFDLDVRIDFDTMLAHYQLDENSQHDLDHLSMLYFGAESYDVPLRVKQGHGNVEQHCLYLAKDLYYTYGLRGKFQKMLDEDPSTHRVFTELTSKLSHLYRDIEFNGFYVVPDQLKTAHAFWTSEERKWSKRLAKYGAINYNSPKQVGDLLFGSLGLKPLEQTKTGANSVSESVLLRIDHPVANIVLRCREASKQLNTFIESWDQKRDVNSFIHPSFKIHGTVTGRPSCKEPNLQQTPRDPRVRSLISAPEGWTLIEVDISQAEMRIAAEMSNCPGLLGAFKRGEDVHTAIVQSTFGISSPTKEQRKKGKAINFGYLYGMGATKFQVYARDNYGLTVSMAEANQSRKSYFSRWSGLGPWHDRQKKFARSHGYVRSLIGRKRRLPAAQGSETQWEQAQAERQAINSPVQSLASDWNLCAAVELHEKLDTKIARVVGTVHDSTLVMVRDDEVPTVARMCKSVMENPYIIRERFGLEMRVPMIGDVAIGPWSLGVSLEEWERAH